MDGIINDLIELQSLEIDGSSFCYVGFVENCLFRGIFTRYRKREEQVLNDHESSEPWIPLGERPIRS